tara:strand:+ start:1102 stop:1242 length:141 start_codon:yes stop_codon:yes gene_type:complete
MLALLALLRTEEVVIALEAPLVAQSYARGRTSTPHPQRRVGKLWRE